MKQKKTSRQAKKKNGGKSRQVVVVRSNDMPLDRDAQAYANLLLDPCDAPLAHPVYAGGEGGYLARFERDWQPQTIGTAGAILFTPGWIGSWPNNDPVHTTGSNSRLQAVIKLGGTPLGTPLADDTGGLWYVADPGNQPGYVALKGVAGAYRPVAACMQITYTGTELERSGTVSMALVSDASAVVGSNLDTVSCSQLRSVSTYIDRTPATMVELKWKPSFGYQQFRSMDVSRTERETAGNAGILLTYSGLAENTAPRVRMVVVYEWVPKWDSGFLQNPSSRARSRNSTDEVLNKLDRMGNWLYSNGRTAAHVAYHAYKAYQAVRGGERRLPRLRDEL